MRNHEERLEEVQKRIAQVQYKQKQRRSYMMSVSSVAVCLVVIVGLASVNARSCSEHYSIRL